MPGEEWFAKKFKPFVIEITDIQRVLNPLFCQTPVMGCFHE
jgi:hypothetical protein